MTRAPSRASILIALGMSLARPFSGNEGGWRLGTSVERRTLELAASIVGGPRKLRDHLKVPSEKLVAWLSGNEPPPREVFLRALDIVLDHLERSEGS